MLTRQDIAKILLDIKAVQLNVHQPFEYSSGIRSPIYCDNRLLISFPDLRGKIIDAFVDQIKTKQLPCELIAGTATAGIPHAAWIADRINKPMIYVRGSAKNHGHSNQIEGYYQPNQQALVVEDLISTGSSALNACKALQQKHVKVKHCLAIFDYQFSASELAFSQYDIKKHTLTDLNSLLTVAQDLQLLSSNECKMINQWQHNPEHWVVC